MTSQEAALPAIMVGPIKDYEMLKTAKGWEIANQDYESYQLDAALINDLKSVLATFEKISIKLYVGTWCSDSQELVPHIVKVLDEVGINRNQISIIGLDCDKKCPENCQEVDQVTFVPTTIIYHDGVELGRMIEQPKVGVEADILAILKK